MADAGTLQRINQHVWRMYPEFNGVYPEERAVSGDSGKSAVLILTYKTRVALPGGKVLPRWVKVNVSASGELLKISSSK